MFNASIEVVIKKFEKDCNNDNIVSIPLKFFNKCKDIFNGILKIGMSQIKVTFIPNFSENTVQLTDFLLKNFYISEELECHAKIENNRLELGPVVGVFVSNGAIRKCNAQSPNFRNAELIKGNEISKTILYFFSIKDVNFINNVILGTYFNKKNLCWDQKTFPFPNVLYDRGGGVLKNQRIISRYIRNQLDDIPDLKKINPIYYFDKWDTYEKLIEDKEMIPYLPLTVIHKTANDLKYMLNKSDDLYLKDCYGSNGRGIMRIKKLPNNTFIYSYCEEEKIVNKRIQSYEHLINLIDSFFKNKKVIIQSAIDVIKINNRPVDMRATVQRNRMGNIVIAAYPVRVGRLNSPVTSTKTGSDVYEFEYFFKEFMGYNTDEIKDLKYEIDKFIITTYKSIEKAYGIFGEIGIDFALDTKGMLWFIECNAKPGKDTLYKSYDRKTILNAFANPLEYAKYISGY